MSRVFCIPGVLFVFAATVLLFLSAISLPYLPALDVARTKFINTEVLSTVGEQMVELRLGIWAYCFYDQNNDRTCTSASHAYALAISNLDKTADVTIGSSWTRGLAVTPVAAAVAFVAFLLSLSLHSVVTLIASLLSFVAAAISLIAFAIDIALFVYLRHQVDKLPNIQSKTTIGVGFWLTFASFLLLILGGCTVCLGRRHRNKRMDNAIPPPPVEEPKEEEPVTTEKKPFWAKFRKNQA
ncbi:hypothetical protein H0H92_005239 [Tricholoma furcatifolium]|nr:hypothetical protein H0H92_005239 [Tricholoma furcatifolium]